VAGFYASQGSASANPAAPASAAAPELAVRGDDKRGLQACVNCHGVQGIGDAAANPYLAGQDGQYLVNALAEWKDGSRHNDPSGQMPAIAKALTDAESRQLAAYFAALPPPLPRNAQQVAARSGKHGRAGQSGPAGATAQLRGSGTEQGAPLTGGAQGPGVGGAAANPGRTTR
jgi:cytochrome c553